MGERIVVAGADASTIEEVQRGLLAEGLATSRVHALGALRRELRARAADLVVVAGRLADARAAEVLRAVKDVDAEDPVLVVVIGEQGDRVERIVALELGADDYLAPPLDPRELALRVRAILRRRAWAGPRAGEQRLGRIVIKSRERRLLVDGRALALSHCEFATLWALANPAGVVHSREALRKALDVGERSDGDRFVDTRVARLRRRLGAAAAQLETVRGLGYRLVGQTSGVAAPNGAEAHRSEP
jgi:DNA-binding response OmpR family regulator